MSPHILYTASFNAPFDVSPSTIWESGDIDLNVDAPIGTQPHYPTLADPSFHTVAQSGILPVDQTLRHSSLWFPIYQPHMPLKLRTYHDVVHRAQALKKDLDTAAHVGETLSTLRQTRDLMQNNQKLIMNVATSHGKSPLLARKRLSDKIHERIRNIEINQKILEKLFTLPGQKKPVEAFQKIWRDYLAAIKKQGAEKEMALKAWRENLGDINLGQDWKNVEDIYSIAITMPLKEWNHVCDTAGTRLINIQYKITREFLRRDLSQEEFLDTFSASHFVEEKSDEDTTLVNGTVVNGTLIGVQSHSIARLPELLEQLPHLVPVILKKLLERRSELSTLIKNLSAINVADEDLLALLKKSQDEWAANLKITDQFSVTPEDQIVFHNVQLDVCDLTPIPLEKFILDRSYAGVAVYQGEEDVPVRADKKRNQTRVTTLVQRLRDQAVQFAEGITHVATETGRLGTTRVSFADPSGIMGHKRVFREGKLLSRDQILRTIMAIQSGPAAVSQPPGTKRRFRLMNSKELREATFDAAQMVVNHAQNGRRFTYPIGFTVSETDATALAKKWLIALNAKQYDGPAVAEFLSAWQWVFLQPVTSPQIRAFYIQAGGFPEPARTLRFLTGTQPGSLMASIEETIEILAAAEEGHRELPDHIQDRLALVRLLFEYGVSLMEQTQINPRDGITIAGFEELAPQAHNIFTTFYQKMQNNGVTSQGPPPGLIIFGAEIQSAKVLENEANPITEDHMMDTNMILIRIATQIAVEKFNAWLSLNEGRNVHVAVVEWVRGDEKVFALPRHLSNGNPVTEELLSRFARIQREVLVQLLPYTLHLEKKIELEDRTVLRPKRWQVTDTLGRTIPVASLQENARTRSGSVWILAIDGKTHKKAILQDWSTLGAAQVKAQMGQVNMRLVAVSPDLPMQASSLSQPTNPEFNALFTRNAMLVMEKDNDVKKQEYLGKNPTQGIWWIESDTGALRQIP